MTRLRVSRWKNLVFTTDSIHSIGGCIPINGRDVFRSRGERETSWWYISNWRGWQSDGKVMRGVIQKDSFRSDKRRNVREELYHWFVRRGCDQMLMIFLKGNEINGRTTPRNAPYLIIHSSSIHRMLDNWNFRSGIHGWNV